MVVCVLISRIPCAFSFYLIIDLKRLNNIYKTREENHCEENFRASALSGCLVLLYKEGNERQLSSYSQRWAWRMRRSVAFVMCSYLTAQFSFSSVRFSFSYALRDCTCCCVYRYCRPPCALTHRCSLLAALLWVEDAAFKSFILAYTACLGVEGDWRNFIHTVLRLIPAVYL